MKKDTKKFVSYVAGIAAGNVVSTAIGAVLPPAGLLLTAVRTVGLLGVSIAVGNNVERETEAFIDDLFDHPTVIIH